MSQCREVYARHDTISAAEYLKDEVFRTVEIEMVEVQVRALPCVHRYTHMCHNTPPRVCSAITHVS